MGMSPLTNRNANRPKPQIITMAIEISIRNGSGWNNYAALKTLKAFPVGTKGLLKQNGIQKLQIEPRDSERPYGIAARYRDADGCLIFTQGFDQNETASGIRNRVVRLLEEGIQTRIANRAKEIGHKAVIEKITAWRRNWPSLKPAPKPHAPANKLRAKFGALRAATGRHSRKYCWDLTYAVINGTMTYRAAVAKFSQ
jgi:hypothetical protein